MIQEIQLSLFVEIIQIALWFVAKTYMTYVNRHFRDRLFLFASVNLPQECQTTL